MPPRKRQLVVDDSDGETQHVKKPKGEKGAKAVAKELGKGQDDQGNTYFELSALRRVGLSTFNGKTLVNIREYYNTADGETKPGKKGISLSLEQYQAFLNVMPQLNNELRAKGHEVQDTDASSAPPVAVAKAKKPSKKSSKANIEETSDEEDEEE